MKWRSYRKILNIVSIRACCIMLNLYLAVVLCVFSVASEDHDSLTLGSNQSQWKVFAWDRRNENPFLVGNAHLLGNGSGKYARNPNTAFIVALHTGYLPSNCLKLEDLPLDNIRNIDGLRVFNSGSCVFQYVPVFFMLESLECWSRDDIAIEDLAHFRDLRKLKWLHINADAFRGPSEDMWKSISAIATLENLAIDALEINDSGIESLAALANLQSLHLSGLLRSKGNHRLAFISRTNLQRVSLTNCELTDSDLKYLSEMPNLNDLSLRENAITNAQARGYLFGMSKLKSLDISHTGIDWDGWRELKHALPNCNLRPSDSESHDLTENDID